VALLLMRIFQNLTPSCDSTYLSSAIWAYSKYGVIDTTILRAHSGEMGYLRRSFEAYFGYNLQVGHILWSHTNMSHLVLHAIMILPIEVPQWGRDLQSWGLRRPSADIVTVPADREPGHGR
jgi:hypothetical protein